MKRRRTEFLAIPITLVGLGLLFLILWAADAGLVPFLIVGVIGAALLVALAVVAMRRPRDPAVEAGASVFEGGAPPADDGLRRILLVIDDAATSGVLERLPGQPEDAKPIVLVVAPAVSSRVARVTGDERAYERATDDLAATLRVLEELGVDAKGHVGSHDPLQAIDEGLREFPADAIVFVASGRDETEWLEQGLIEIARRRYSVPVHELSATP